MTTTGPVGAGARRGAVTDAVGIPGSAAAARHAEELLADAAAVRGDLAGTGSADR
ncbi:MAG: hypothetical protein M5U19_04960 [Microthrixaceae bacterium]|nr:hypothetical protein [Microthrixaceae bacterium]